MPKRVDQNQPEIVDALRKIGCTVQHLHTVGKGCPDLLVGVGTTNLLLEVKRHGEALNEREETWFEQWDGPCRVVHSVDEALAAVWEYRYR